MGLHHSHNSSCEYVLAGTATDGAKDVVMRKKSKCEVDSDKKYLFMQLLHQEMLPKEVNRNIVDFLEMKDVKRRCGTFLGQNVKGDVVYIYNRDGQRRMSNLPIFVTYSLSHDSQIFQLGVSDAVEFWAQLAILYIIIS